MSRLKDIADAVGVSMMTVSRALNNPDLVKPELRDTIITTANKLNYTPHHGARSMATNKTGIIQILTEMAVKDQYFLTLLSGIIDSLSEHGYAIIVEKQHTMRYRCDGVIVMSLHSGQTDFFSRNIRQACVLFGKTDEAVDYVDLNNESGIAMATEHLISLGHRGIGFIAIDLDEPYVKERLNGYLRTMHKHGLSPHSEWIASSPSDIRNARATAAELLRNIEISAIVCSNDLIATGVIEAARELGKRVPEDLSVSGFDGVMLHSVTDPKLTTIVQPVYEIGQKLSEVLIERINNPDNGRQCFIFEPTLLVAESTCSPRQ